MKTRISVFITATLLLLLGTTSAVAQGAKINFNKNGATVFQTAISDIDSIVFKQETVEEDWVLINGVKWAIRNVGAQNPEDYGNYYQWNRGTTDFLLYNDYYNSNYWDSAKWLTANDPSPAGYRVPTFAELQSLTDTTYVTYEWTTRNGVYGEKFTDKTNGNSIFLPAAGRSVDGELSPVGSYGLYWSNTQVGNYYYWAFFLHFGNGFARVFWDNKAYGLTVRPVAGDNKPIVPFDNNTIFSLIGSIFGDESSWWITDLDFTFVSKRNDHITYKIENVTLKAGEFKVRMNHDWGYNFGWGQVAVEGEGFSDTGNSNITTTGGFFSEITFEFDWDSQIINPKLKFDRNNNVDEWVIINGVKWATHNVAEPGTFTDKPEDTGMFYQWNRKIAWPATGSVTDWDSSSSTGGAWGKANDPSPAGYRVPTPYEMRSLTNTTHVTYEWTTRNGVYGGRFTDRTNGNSIFLPAAGFRYFEDGALKYVGSLGYYWNGAQNYFDFDMCDLYFDIVSASLSSGRVNSSGFTVRPVAE